MRKTRRRKRSLTRVKYFLAFVAAVVVIFAVVKYFPDSDANLPQNSGVRCVMLMGVDRREDDVGRSDTLMIACLDEKNHKASLLSVPRDTRVAIDGHGYDKINHAFAFGGQKLTQKSLEELLGTKIDNFIMIDTHAFERIIDAMGGVDLDVEKRMYYGDPWDDDGGLVIDLYPGEQHLDGYTAEQYVRYRDGEGDIGRISRQQKFMTALLKQAVNPAIITRLPEILDKVRTSVQTDMTPAELADFAREVKSWQENGLNAVTVPGKPAYYEDVSYWLPDIVALRTEFAERNGVSDMQKVKEKAQVVAAKYDRDMPRELKDSDGTDSAKSSKTSGRRDKNATDETTPTDNDDTKRPTDRQDTDENENSETDGERKTDDKQPVRPENISVMVINSSGINGAGAQVAKILQQKGFVISGVETGRTDSRENTTITTAADNTDIFYGMPFDCLILDGGDENQAVVNIGRDFDAAIKQGE